MIGPALRGLGAVARFAGRHWALTGTTVAAAAADEVLLDGELRGELADGIKSAASNVTDKEKREKFKEGFNQNVAGARKAVAEFRKTTNEVVEGAKEVAELAKDPEKALEKVLEGDTAPDGKKKSGGLLDRILGFFKDDDGSQNWMTTLATGAATLWGSKKLFGKNGLFGGGDGEKSSSWFSSLFKIAGLTAIGVAIYKYWDNIKDFGNKIADSGKNFVNKFTGGENAPQFGQSGGLQDRVIEAPTSVASLSTPATTSPTVAQRSLDGIEPLGGTFSTSTAAPPVEVASRDPNGITSVVNNAAAAKPAETDDEYAARRVAEVKASLVSPVRTEFGAQMNAKMKDYADTLPKQRGMEEQEPDTLGLGA